MSRTTVGLLLALLPLLGLAVAVGAVAGPYGLLFGFAAVALTVYIGVRATRGGTTWFLPFVAVLMVPAIAVPGQEILVGVLTDDFAYNAALYHSFGIDTPAGSCQAVYDSSWDKEWSCPPGRATLTLLPGVLNLAPLGWLGARSRRTRLGAGIAGGIGAVRLLTPAVVYLSSSQVHFIGSYQFYNGATVDNFSPLLSIASWFISLIAFVLTGVATRHSDALQP